MAFELQTLFSENEPSDTECRTKDEGQALNLSQLRTGDFTSKEL